jgi:hypothetical protein
VAAVLALHVLGPAHPGDGLVLAAIRALGDELEALQAVDADEPPGELGGSQPGLTAAGAGGAPQGSLGGGLCLGRASQASVRAFGHATRVPGATEP